MFCITWREVRRKMYCKASSPLRKMTSNKEILLSNRTLPHIHDGPAETYELGGAGTSFLSQKHPGWNLSRLRHLIQKKLWNTLCSRREVWIDSRRRCSARLGTQRHRGEGGHLTWVVSTVLAVTLLLPFPTKYAELTDFLLAPVNEPFFL